MRRSVYITLAVVLIGYAGVCAAMYVFQRSLLYYPQPRMVTATESTMRLPVDGAELVVTGAAVRWPEGYRLFRR